MKRNTEVEFIKNKNQPKGSFINLLQAMGVTNYATGKKR